MKKAAILMVFVLAWSICFPSIPAVSEECVGTATANPDYSVSASPTDLSSLVGLQQEIISQQESTLSALLIFISQQQSALDITKTALVERNAFIDSLQADLDSANADLAMRNAQLDALQLKFDAASTALTTLEKQKLSLEQKETELTALQAQLSSREAIVSNKEEELNTLQTQLDSKQAQFDAQQTLLSEKEAETVQLQTNLDAQSALISQQQAALDAANAALADREFQLETLQAELESYSTINIWTEIITALSRALNNAALTATVDPETGAVVLSSSMLFDTGKNEIKADGKALLDSFIPVYLGVLLREEYKPYLSAIIVEGHTDSTGSYTANLILSSNRALEVCQYVLNDQHLTSRQKVRLRELLTATGRGPANLILDENGIEDKAASRRVEFKFSLKDSEMINEIRTLLQNSLQ